jgi:hypothetical protein
MRMQFTLNLKELLEAIDIVGVVAPQPLVGDVTGYRFVVHDGVCSIYSRDKTRVSRAQIPVLESDGDADLIYPESAIEPLALTRGSTVTISCQVDGDRYIVAYQTDTGTTDECPSTNPKFIAQLDEDYNAAAVGTVTFPSGILRVGLSTVKGHLATDDRTDDLYKNLQTFDASKPEWEKGNGVLFAADAIRAAYFDCAAFKDKHLALHSDNIAHILSYLTKVEGDVSYRLGTNMMFLEDSRGRILGFSRSNKVHPRYSYFPLDKDGYIFRVDKALMQSATAYLRQRIADKGKDKIRFAYDHDSGQFTVSLNESKAKTRFEAIPINAREFRNPESFSVNVNVDQLRDLFNTVCNEVEFRVSLIQKGSKTGAIFRTIDRFWLDANGKVAQDNTQEGAVECKVTRLMPSKD